MDSSDLDEQQVWKLHAGVVNRLAWLRWLAARMDQRRWTKSDPLRQQVLAATLEMERLANMLLRIGIIATQPSRARRIGWSDDTQPPY